MLQGQWMLCACLRDMSIEYELSLMMSWPVGQTSSALRSCPARLSNRPREHEPPRFGLPRRSHSNRIGTIDAAQLALYLRSNPDVFRLDSVAVLVSKGACTLVSDGSLRSTSGLPSRPPTGAQFYTDTRSGLLP